jgi:MlaC protein
VLHKSLQDAPPMIRHKTLLAITVMFACSTTADAAKVSNAHQSCIVEAIDAGSAAINNQAQLKALYRRYFNGEKIAQLAAGASWQQYDEAKKTAQRSRVQQIVIEQLAPNLAPYKGSGVRFLYESGHKVKGVVTAPHGEKRRVTWHFDVSGCRFIDVSVDGLGSLISLVGKEPL